MAEHRSSQKPGLKLDNQQLRISIGLGLGAIICVADDNQRAGSFLEQRISMALR